MKAVVQRVNRASVEVSDKLVASINKGILVLLGIADNEDEKSKIDWMIQKLLKLRIFNDENEKMNLSVEDIKGEILIISNFTLYGDARKGTRPTYINAAKNDFALEIYDDFINRIEKSTKLNVQKGEFGAYMKVDLENDGPVTLIIEK